MEQKNFTPDKGPALTPFNTSERKQSRKQSSTKNREDLKAFGMYNTIQSLSQKNARMWQIDALISKSAFFIALLILIHAVNLPKTVPVLVTVDTQGQATYAGKIDQNYWGADKIPENAKTYQIKRLLANMYTWTIDRKAQQSFVREAENICQGVAAQQLATFFTENNPFDFMGIRTQEIKLEEPLRQTDKTYVVYYNISTYDRGMKTGEKRFSALVTLNFYHGIPETNPLGIYITSFDIKEVL